jgi:hypothetical protein
MNEEHRKEEEQRYAGLTTAALADAGERTALKSAPTLGENSVATAGTATAVATDEQTDAAVFRPRRRRSFAFAGIRSRGALWTNPAARWSRRIVWSRGR